MFDDIEQPRHKDKFTPKVLDDLSIDELHEYIDELKSEIARVEKDIDVKKASISAAESVFKS